MYKAPLSAESLMEQEVRQLFERHTIAEIKVREDLTRYPFTPPLLFHLSSLHQSIFFLLPSSPIFWSLVDSIYL